MLLNNDTLLAPGWLDSLLSVMDSDPSVGIVSPVTNYVGEGQQIDVQAEDLSADTNIIAQYAKRIADRSEVRYEPNRLVFFCVLIRRELFDLVGYLDEDYENGNFEDDDYCLRARMAGYRLAIAENAFVYHHGSVTFDSNRISHDQWMQINWARFYRKAGRIATLQRPCLSLKKSDRSISVVVRTRDRPHLLARALTSLANQTLRDFEVVVVNDGGKDVSPVIESFEDCFPLSYLHHAASKGRTAAINSGIRNTQGAWVAYLDDDDIVYPWHFEVLFRAAESTGAKVVYGDYNRALFTDSQSHHPIELVGALPWEYNERELLVQNFIPIHSWLHARDRVEEVGLWDDNLVCLEDYDFLLRLSALHDFVHVPKVTCEYRYYLDIANSITTARIEYLDSLEHIYGKWPTKDPALIRERNLLISGLNAQIERIRQLRMESSGSPEADRLVSREIIRLAVGL